MGYLVACHFTKQAPSGSSVRGALSPSIGFAIYRHQVLPLFAIDTFRAAKPSRSPFSVATPTTDLPLELAPDLAPLSVLYEQLKEEGIANGLKRSYINLACILCSCLGQDVLSVYGDDDGKRLRVPGDTGQGRQDSRPVRESSGWVRERVGVKSCGRIRRCHSASNHLSAV